MIKNILFGIIIGMVNIIPGVSGGTIIVILGIFDKLMNSIASLFKRNAFNRKESIFFLLQLMIGCLIGLISFANLIDFFINHFPTQTIYFFIGLILFSIPNIIKREIKKLKISPIFLCLGAIIVLGLVLSNNNNHDLINTFPPLTIFHLLKVLGLGIIIAIAMILPGISGAMVLLILGEYYLFKSYIAKVLSFQMEIIIPLIFIGLGIIIGIIISAKVITWLLNNHRKEVMSTIIGLILMSALILIPFKITYTFPIIITSLISLLSGGLIMIIINKVAKKT